MNKISSRSVRLFISIVLWAIITIIVMWVTRDIVGDIPWPVLTR